MNMGRRALLGAGVLGLAAVALPEESAAASDFGSGALGAWQANRPVLSSPSYWQAAEVAAFGDSILAFDAHDLAVRLGTTPLAVDAWPGRPTPALVDSVRHVQQTYGLPQTVVVASGSNDIFDPPTLAPAIDEVMTIAEGRKVVWVNVQVCRTKAATPVADQRNTGLVNGTIAAAAAKYPNMIVVPWFEFLAAKSFRCSYYLRDGVHTNDRGRAARNTMIVQAL